MRLVVLGGKGAFAIQYARYIQDRREPESTVTRTAHRLPSSACSQESPLHMHIRSR
jgi:hypothetical protein